MSTSDGNCKDGASKSKSDVNNMLQNMRIDAAVSVCANYCGKEGDDINNTCNKCKIVKYCNATCKKKHRHKHKKQCEEHVRLATEQHYAELKRAAELHDEELFKPPPPAEDCPICFLRLPSLGSGSQYYACCGKLICCGCVHAPVYDNQGNIVAEKKCPFCRTPYPNSEDEAVKRLKKRFEVDDPEAIYDIGCYYRDGTNGYAQDYTKALELFHRVGELGYARAYGYIGHSYANGVGVEVDTKKANHYWELAAIGGDSMARCKLGIMEVLADNFDRAIKHCMIAIRCGSSESLEAIKRLHSDGCATKEDYATALLSYQAYLSEIKSPQRDIAAQLDERYRYYELGE